MAAVDSTSLPSITLQRKRFELLGLAYSQGKTIKNWMKALIITVLFFGLPSLPLLSHPLKDNAVTMQQIIIWGFRLLIFVFMYYWIMKLANHLMAAKSDFQSYLNNVGYALPDTNSREEIRTVRRKIAYTTIQYLATIPTLFGLFLLTNRTNYGYIIGQEIIYCALIINLLITLKFWFTRGSDESPWLGLRYLVLMFLPSMFVWGVEVVIDFFTAISKPRFSFNVLQLSWGLIYPFVFFFVLFATLYTTRKTKREKLALQEAWEAEYRRKIRYIKEKNKISQALFWLEVRWHQFLSLFKLKKEVTEEDLDKKPSLIIVNSIWISLFLVTIPIGFLVPWILFPYDNILLLAFLLVAYAYSMVKYYRQSVDIIPEIPKNVKDEPPEIRTASAMQTSYISAMLPIFIFVVTAFLLNGIITKGNLTGYRAILATSLNWIALLSVVPLSIRIYFLLKQYTREYRSKESVTLFRNSYILVVGYHLFFYLSLVVAYFASNYLDFQLIPTESFAMYALLFVALAVLPIAYVYLIPLVKDEKDRRIIDIGSLVILVLIDIGVVTWFVYDQIITVFMS